MVDTTEQDFDSVFSLNARGAFFAMQEAARVLPDGGRIMVFNNGDTDTRPYSTVDEIVPVMKGRNYVEKDGVFQAKRVRSVYPVASVTSTSSTPLFAPFISGAQRLPNGDTLITDGPDGRIFEITKKGDTAWAYQNAFAAQAPVITAPNGFVIRPERLFRAYRYSPSYAGLKGKGLDSGSGSSTGKAKTSY